MNVLYALESIRTPVLDRIMLFFTALGEETMFLIIALIVFWCVNKRQGYYMLTVGFSGIVISEALKILCRIPRPWVKDPNFTIVEAAREKAAGYSFPSGHTVNAVTVYGTTARWTDRKWLRWACILLTAVIGFSRMYLGVHTPADVFTSLAVGIILVLVLYPMFNKEKDINILPVIIFMIAISLVYVLFLELYRFPADTDPRNLANSIQNGYKILGAAIGMLISCVIDERYTKFETAAPLWVQAVKAAGGFAVILAIKEGLKGPLAAILPQSAAAGVRYFIIVLFAAAVWPLTFKPLTSLANKSK
ncbi:MAG: phosphatase PAP2 family protein [Oscillospiraceae bacterium]|nr:phosphatase PAP2 family protein [Oscillospiraceae bacterium]